jgi:divalent metal cation (Fe/Co/Zn/Cd) transporter
MSMLTIGPSSSRQDQLTRRIRLVASIAIAYNAGEAAVAIAAGAAAGSGALIGFGLDSVIEVSSALALIWQFSARDHQAREAREARTLRIIAVAFLALAAYIALESGRALLGAGEPRSSLPGIALAATSLLLMPWLSSAQRKAGRELGSATAVADSKQTLLCTYLSGVLLIGLLLNTTLGWGWADPIAGLAIAAVALKEGRDAWRGEGCCAPAGTAADPCGDDCDCC